MKKTCITIAVFFLYAAYAFCAHQNSIHAAILKKERVDSVYFMPDQTDFYKELLLWLFLNTNGSIKAALYRLTDRDVAQALVAAHERGVPVEVVFDPTAITTRYSLASHLYKAGISLYCYQPTGLRPPFPKSFPSIMHHKTFVFEDVLGCPSIIAWGSLNPTNAGFNGNEEVTHITDQHAKAFTDQFALLKSRSAHVSDEYFSKLLKEKNKISREQSLTRTAFSFVKRFFHR